MTSLINSIKNLAKQTGEDTKTRFSLSPAAGGGECGFGQWLGGMRMVARLPEGVPRQFRKTLWLTLAEKHLAGRGVKWPEVEEFCFNEFTNPDDEELGVQIVKDVHRTGCSLFCGVSGKDNQALLKRVLLAYARWNKAVGYCQGFNMLAALILQVMDKSEVDSVKVMIFLIEGVLPESYFANNLRGLSVDMAVFRDLLRLKLPTLSRHFEQLQCDSKDSGTSYEPPLTNVFTMQWFLTLFCNCLPQDTVLRVWDLIFLEGNHVLLCTALAIWSTLSDRILSVESADEFYCIMGVLTREMLEFGLMDANALIKAIVSFQLPELGELREKYLYNITPWTQSVSTVARRGLRLFYSDDDTDTEEDDDKIAVATAYGLFRSPKRKDTASGVMSPPRALTCPDKDKIAMDISALTKQYRKLRERQKQAHVILTAACGSQGLVGPTASPAMNHLLMGKFALVNSKGRRLGPPTGAVPPPSSAKPRPASPSSERKGRVISGETLHWKDALDKNGQMKDGDEGVVSPEGGSQTSSRRGSTSSSSTSTELCDDPHRISDSEDQTNSLSEPQHTDRSQPSTPRVQPKIVHSLDLESCKEHLEDKDYEESQKKQCDEVDQLREEIASISSISPGDDERPHRRKPSSFRIDPEELRQLDRKLSLKIVEIERRKSSAGIESEDLNSKVLFPFDRDYIGDGEKSDRADSPSSIPDDRLCCTEDLVGSFEDDLEPVPDLITTHKPLNFRMTSLEECDETKLNDADPSETSAKELEDEDLKSYNESDISDEDYEQDECQTGSECKFNFDDLFPPKEDENSKELNDGDEILVNFQNKNLTDCASVQLSSGLTELGTRPTEIYLGTQSESKWHTLDSNDLSLKIRNQNIYENPLFMNIKSCSETKERNITPSTEISVEYSNNYELKIKGNTSDEITNMRNENFGKVKNDQLKVSSDNVKVFSLFENKTNESCGSQEIAANFLFEDKNIENHKNDEECTKSKCISYQSSTTVSKSSFEVTRKFDIRSSLLTLPNALPDVTAVSSSDFDIDSIRKKYANFEEVSNKRTVLEAPDVKKLILEECKDDIDSMLRVESRSLLGLSENQEYKPIFNLEKNEICSNLDCGISNEESFDHRTINTKESSFVIKSECQGDNIKSSVCDIFSVQGQSELNNLVLNTETEKISQHSSPSKRRGSEVALNLILKENSQILTKIQQQSRRNSEAWAHSKSLTENETSITFQQDKDLRIGAELRLLNNTILESFETSCETKFVPNESDEEKATDEDEICGIGQVECSNTILNKIKCENPQDKPVIKDNEIVSKLCTGEYVDSCQKTDKLLKERKDKALPDVCKYDYEHYKGSRLEEEKMNKISTEDGDLESSSFHVLKTNSTGIPNNKDSVRNRADSYAVSPIKYSDDSMKSSANYTDEFKFQKLNSQNSLESNYVTNIQPNPSTIPIPIPSSIGDESSTRERSALSFTGISNVQINSDTNEDIIKELQYLDIKPEETLDYSANKKTPLSTPNLENHLTLLEKDISTVTAKDYSPTKETNGLSRIDAKGYSSSKEYSAELHSPGNISQPVAENSVFSKSSQKEKENSTQYMETGELNDYKKSKKHLLDSENKHTVLSSDLDTCRPALQRNYRHHKSSSVDIVVLDKLADPAKSKGAFARSTTIEDDDSMYMNSYKSHGRLLVEKGELKTQWTAEGLGKSTDMAETSAYDFRKVSNSDGDGENSSYSKFRSKTCKSPPYVRPSDKILFRYKSEDHGTGTNPPRYRFSSASPIRSRLESFSSDADISSRNVNRTKSPSPTLYRERLVSRRLDSSGSDFSNNSKEYPGHSRTESLDSSSSRTLGYLRRRTESVDSFREEKKVLSPVSPVKFNPFPVRSSSRQPKDLGVKLGLYQPPKADKSPNKRLT